MMLFSVPEHVVFSPSTCHALHLEFFVRLGTQEAALVFFTICRSAYMRSSEHRNLPGSLSLAPLGAVSCEVT